MFALDEGSDFGEFVFAGGFHRERVESQLRCGSGEEAFAEIFEELALHGVLTERGAIDMGAIGFVANHEAFSSHDLEHLEDGGVAGGPVLIKDVMNLAHRGRLLLPEDLEEFEFGFCRAGDGAVFHDGQTLYEEFRNCQRKSS